MSDPFDLEGLVRHAGEYAERMLIKERQKALTPIFELLYTLPDGTPGLDIIACVWYGEIDKQLALLTVKKRAREVGATALCFMSEAWLAVRSSINPDWKTPPSEDPQRREIVFACATDGKRKLARSWQIVRDKPGGRIMSLVERDHSTADRFEGRMIDGILP